MYELMKPQIIVKQNIISMFTMITKLESLFKLSALARTRVCHCLSAPESGPVITLPRSHEQTDKATCSGYICHPSYFELKSWSHKDVICSKSVTLLLSLWAVPFTVGSSSLSHWLPLVLNQALPPIHHVMFAFVSTAASCIFAYSILSESLCLWKLSHGCLFHWVGWWKGTWISRLYW